MNVQHICTRSVVKSQSLPTSLVVGIDVAIPRSQYSFARVHHSVVTIIRLVVTAICCISRLISESGSECQQNSCSLHQAHRSLRTDADQISAAASRCCIRPRPLIILRISLRLSFSRWSRTHYTTIRLLEVLYGSQISHSKLVE